ncbi:MAG: pantetheine-phosphate adenylyltransferase [Coriobacteriia bacterium]|nr:pantetheine-phosphate adenylyltransferase [Coriobacteriia bacterium]
MKRAVIPGTFDPITNGHLDVIERASALFDEIVVGVASSEEKNGRGTLFSVEERVDMILTATKHLSNIEVKSFNNLLIDFACDTSADVIVKGLRAVTDFEHEFQMAALNWQLDSEIETMFIMAIPENMYLSSSAVKEIAKHGGSTKGLVPEGVDVLLRDKL